MLTRRFARAQEENPDREVDRDGGGWPDLVLIDGGLGQLNAARATLADVPAGLRERTLAAAACRVTPAPAASRSRCPAPSTRPGPRHRHGVRTADRGW